MAHNQVLGLCWACWACLRDLQPPWLAEHSQGTMDHVKRVSRPRTV